MTPSRGSSAVPPDELRRACGHFPTGVAIVTSIDGEGQPVGATVNAFSSLSLDPPLVLACLGLASQTLAAIRDRDAFAVNVLAAGHEHLSTSFARSGAIAAWDSAAHHPGPTGCPSLHDALAVLDCRVEGRLPGGDHEIVIGRVVHVETREDQRREPLLFYRGEYLQVGVSGVDR